MILNGFNESFSNRILTGMIFASTCKKKHHFEIITVSCTNSRIVFWCFLKNYAKILCSNIKILWFGLRFQDLIIVNDSWFYLLCSYKEEVSVKFFCLITTYLFSFATSPNLFCCLFLFSFVVVFLFTFAKSKSGFCLVWFVCMIKV